MNRRTFFATLAGGAAVAAISKVACLANASPPEAGVDEPSFYQWKALNGSGNLAPHPIRAIQCNGYNWKKVAKYAGASRVEKVGPIEMRLWFKSGDSECFEAVHLSQWLVLYGSEICDHFFMGNRAFRILFSPGIPIMKWSRQ